MPLFARIAFAAVDFAARKGLAAPSAGDSGSGIQESIELGARAFAARRTRIGIFGGTATFWSRETICRRA